MPEEANEPPLSEADSLNKKQFPRHYFENNAAGLRALIKAVEKFFPWSVPHSGKEKA
jgi:hypothetical protein